MEFHFAPRPEPRIPAKRLEMGLRVLWGAMRSAEIRPKTGPKTRRGRPARRLPTRGNPHHNWVLGVELAGLEPATSWVRSKALSA